MKKSDLINKIKESVKEGPNTVDKPEADAAIALAGKGFDIVDRDGSNHWYWEMENGNVSPASLDLSKILELAQDYPKNYTNSTLRFGPIPW